MTRSKYADWSRTADQIYTIINREEDKAYVNWTAEKIKFIQDYFEQAYNSIKDDIKSTIDEYNSPDDKIAEKIRNNDDYKKVNQENSMYKVFGRMSELSKHSKEIKAEEKKDEAERQKEQKLLEDMQNENAHREEINRALSKVIPGSNACSSSSVEKQQLEDRANIEDDVQEEIAENEIDGGNLSNQIYEINKRFVMNNPEEPFKLSVKSKSSKKKYKI